MINKSIAEINSKIQSGKAVVLTAEEFKELAQHNSHEELAEKVDVVTTATFGPMCSSGMFINFGHSNPPIRMEEIYLNDVQIYAGVAAVDAYIGATSESKYDNKYGGAHIIQELIEGKPVKLSAFAKGTNCYPSKHIEITIDKEIVNEMFLFNPRNAYQNYAVAVNTTKKTLYTYMGTLLPELANANYSTSGEISPLLNDPYLKTIGIGTKIFLGGTTGFVAWNGTQFNTVKPRNEKGIPTSNAATLSVIGDAKKMNSDFIKAAYYEKYGVSLFVGIGIPIPVLNSEIAGYLSIRNKDIETSIVDYGNADHPVLQKTNYEELQSGKIDLSGKEIKTAPLSSILKAREICNILKSWIVQGDFLLSEPVQLFPEKCSVKSLN